MLVVSDAIQNGVISDCYGKRGNNFINGMPTYSLPFEILDVPSNAESFVVILDDKDSVPVCGFVWLHWLIANLTRTSVLANESQTAKDFLQGVNSWVKQTDFNRKLATCYGGMAPPDKGHYYELSVYALDATLKLTNGFYYNELYWVMQKHIVSVATLKGFYNV